MDVLFVRQGEYEKGDAAFPLIEEAASLYGVPLGEAFVARTEKGKPYLKYRNEESAASIGISVSHSGDLWMCLFSEECCGVDVQYARDTDKAKIIERFFTLGEREYVNSGGDFFKVWCRREALGKYTGEGWFGSYPDSCPGGVLADSVTVNGKVLFFHDISKDMLGGAGISVSKDFDAICLTCSPEKPVIKQI